MFERLRHFVSSSATTHDGAVSNEALEPKAAPQSPVDALSEQTSERTDSHGAPAPSATSETQSPWSAKTAASNLVAVPRAVVSEKVDATKRFVLQKKAQAAEAISGFSDGTKNLATAGAQKVGDALDATKQALLTGPAEAIVAHSKTIFWTVIAGAAVVAFAYGAGSAIPAAIAGSAKRFAWQAAKARLRPARQAGSGTKSTTVPLEQPKRGNET